MDIAIMPDLLIIRNYAPVIPAKAGIQDALFI